MPLLMVLSGLARFLPFILPRWHVACMGWILYIFTALVVDDATEHM